MSSEKLYISKFFDEFEEGKKREWLDPVTSCGNLKSTPILCL